MDYFQVTYKDIPILGSFGAFAFAEVRSKPALIFSTKAASTTAQTWVTGVTRTEQESTGCAKPCEITVEANLYYFTLVTSILYSLLELSY